jgi:hypothetical protein
MGRQVRFRAAPADIEMLEAFLLANGARFIPWRADTPQVTPVDTLQPPDGSPEPYIVRERDLASVHRYFVESQGSWLADQSATPMLDFSRGRLDHDPMSYGRLHFESHVQRDEGWVPVPADFARWADRILGWIRRKFTYNRNEQLYYGPGAAVELPASRE